MMKQSVQKKITAFLGDNPEMIVFIADPETDTIFQGYKDRVIPRQIVDKSGAVANVIKKALQSKTGERERGELTLMFGGALNAIAADYSSVGGIIKKKIRTAIAKVKGRKSKRSNS